MNCENVFSPLIVCVDDKFTAVPETEVIGIVPDKIEPPFIAGAVLFTQYFVIYSLSNAVV